MVSHPLFVGIDVAKDALDVACGRPPRRGASRTMTLASPRSWPSCVLPSPPWWCWKPRPFHGAVTAALAAAGLPVVVVNPRQVRAFAHAVGIVAKTDRIDARVLAHFADAVRPTPRPLPDAATKTCARCSCGGGS